jgi:hypothetical protein
MGPWLRLLRSERNFEGAKIRPLPVEKSSSSVSLVVVESNSDRRFDPNFATHLLLDIAHEQSVENLLQKLILRGMENPQSDLACLQIWLVDKGDLCSVCPQRPKCPDQTRCLHLERVFRVSMIPTRGCLWEWAWLARWLREAGNLS